MQRDMDLIRAILLEVEKNASLAGCPVQIAGRTREELYYNAMQAKDAGFIEAKFAPGSPDFHVIRLTYAGHEFLDALRNDPTWNKTKQIVIEKTGTLTMEGLKLAVSTLITHAFKP